MSNTAIVTSCDTGWLFDHCIAITNAISGCGFSCPSYLFAVGQPYFMSDKGSRESDGGPSCLEKSSHRIQKRGKRKVSFQSFLHPIQKEI